MPQALVGFLMVGLPRFELGSPAVWGEHLPLYQGKRIEGETVGVSPPEAGRIPGYPTAPVTLTVLLLGLQNS